MKSIIRRLEIIEKELGGTCAVPGKERFIVIPYPDGQNEIFERQKQEKINKLKEKYGQNISGSGLVFIGVRKFSEKWRASNEYQKKIEQY